MKSNQVPSLVLDSGRESLVSSSGALLLRETIAAAGLDRGLSAGLSPWRRDRGMHDPGKVLLDVATAIAFGGDCLADLAAVRAQPAVFGPVASDPTVSRVFAALAADPDAAVAAIRAARGAGCGVGTSSTAGRRTWGPQRRSGDRGHLRHLGDGALGQGGRRAHLQTGLWVRADVRVRRPRRARHRRDPGGGVAAGEASPWNSADHLTTLETALAQLPEHERAHVLVRADTGACSKVSLHKITDAGLEYSIGFQAQDTVKAAVEAIPEQAWRAALDGDGEPREGAQVAGLTGWMPIPVTQQRASRPGPKDWPEGMRVIARRERPHPGAQLRLTDHQG